jgi:hypothetical protein
MELLSASLKNMEITVLGVKLRLGVIILIVVLYWLLWGHVLCSCSRVGLLEGIDETLKKCFDASNNPIDCPPVVDGPTAAQTAPVDLSTETAPAEQFIGGQEEDKEEAAVVNPELLSLKSVEGFVGANTNYGESARYSLSNNKRVNTSSWFSPNLTYTKGGKEGKGVQNILNRQKQPVPLPEGQLLMFANTPFKPQCCPNAYSNSMGCACMTVDQYNYLIDRGGNNVPYSEY